MKNKSTLFAFFLSGMAALIYEVAWVRPIGFVYDSTIFVVSAITASLMGGLALGSLLAGRFLSRLKRPMYVYALMELGIGIYGILLIELVKLLPAVNEHLVTVTSLLQYNTMIFGSVFLLLLIPTTLMGATFPTVAQAYLSERIGRGIGELYSANNIGAIIGSLSAGFILIPALGIKGSILLAAFFNLSAALLVLYAFHRRELRLIAPVAGSAFAVLALLSQYDVTTLFSQGPFGLYKQEYLGEQKVVFYREGLYGSVVVVRESPDHAIYQLLLNGQGSSSLRFGDMRVSMLLGYLPRLLNPEASTAVVIGFGIGGTARVLSRRLDTTTIEIEPEVINAASFFAKANEGILTEPKHRIVVDDARNHLETTKGRFDLIVNHPLDPHKSHSSLLFTEEFLKLAKSRLTPRGMYVQWIPTYLLTPQDFKDFYFTFQSVFPHQACFINFRKGEVVRGEAAYAENGPADDVVAPENGQELILVGSREPIGLDLERLKKGYSRLLEEERRALQAYSLASPESILNLLLFRGEDLKGYDTGASLITDDLPRLEFTTVLNRIQKGGLQDQVVGPLLAYLKVKK